MKFKVGDIIGLINDKCSSGETYEIIGINCDSYEHPNSLHTIFAVEEIYEVKGMKHCSDKKEAYESENRWSLI